MIKLRLSIAALLILGICLVLPSPSFSQDVKVDSDTISGLGARNIGSAEMSGRVAAVAAVKENGRLTVYIGAASGGVWKSMNGGTTFKPVFDKQTSQSIGAIAIDPSAPKTIWVGTGESWTRNSTSIGDGIYKSTDGGDSWTNLGCKNSERISKILIDPKDGNTVYACVPGKLWSDSDDRGVYKTSDGGKSWTQILEGGNASTGCSMLSMSSKDSKTIFAGTWDFRRKGWTFRSGGENATAPSGSGLLMTTDGGANWTDLDAKSAKGLPPKPWGRIAVAIAPSNANVVYALIESPDSALYRSDDGGKTWGRRDASQMMVWRPFYFANLIVDPKDENKVYKPDGGLILSTDGGKSFSGISGGAHGDFHDVWIDPENTNHVITVDDGGVWYSFDSGNNWWKANNLPISQFYHVSVDMDDPYHVFGGLQDNSVWMGDSAYPGGITNSRWANLGGGDGFWAFPDPVRPELRVCRIAGRRNRARESRHARVAQHQAAAELRRRQVAVQLEHADSHEPQRPRNGLHRRAIPIPLARSWPDLGPDLTGSDDQRSGKAKTGRIGRRHGGQLRRRNSHHHLFDQRVASRRPSDLGRNGRRQPANHARRRENLDERGRQRAQFAESLLGIVGRSKPLRRRHCIRHF